MEDDFEEMENLMDDDPALDYILYDEMSREDGNGEDHNKAGGSGCFGILVLLLIPAAVFLLFSSLFARLIFVNT